MTEAHLVEKRLAFIETMLSDLRRHVRPEEILTDLKSLRFAEHTLQLAIQAALDVASHIVSDERLGEPGRNRDLFLLLARGGWLPQEQVEVMQRITGFRNILVHGYLEVDPQVVREIVENGLPDLERFIAAVRSKLGGLS
jgi:uncharacterized protein YutE (UPF0331/DUF86 family)